MPCVGMSALRSARLLYGQQKLLSHNSIFLLRILCRYKADLVEMGVNLNHISHYCLLLSHVNFC